MSDKEIAWDLTEIFSGHDDPKITESMNAIEEDTIEFIKKYKGNIHIANFSAQNLHDLLVRYENILLGLDEIGTFSVNLFNANTTIPENKALLNKYSNFDSKISKNLAFVELEIGKLIQNSHHIIQKEKLNIYKHYLEKIKLKSPYKLSEIEEQLILEKDESGIIAWEQLKDSWLSSRRFEATIEGKKKKITISDFFPLLFHPDRDSRISVVTSVCGSLEKEEEIYSSALRHICSDWVKNVNRRHYNSPLHQSLLDNDTTQDIIDNLIKTIEDNINIYQRFLNIKARLLNLPKLNGADIWAFFPSENKFTWKETNHLMAEVFGNFDEEFKENAIDMFNKNRIDATPREGKVGAIYCSFCYKEKTPYILTSFKGLMSDILTLAHEIGHGIHSSLSSKEQTFLNFHPGATVAETASIFGELLLTDHLLNTVKAKTERISLLANQLSNASFLFRGTARFRFEQNLYKAIQEGEYLDGQKISQYWCAARDKVHGDNVEWFDEMKWEWIAVPQYFYPDFRFYNYPYSYAQLFVYAIYKSFKDEGTSFIPKFKNLLSLGGSVSPEELSKLLGLDITKPDFWQLGIKQFETFVEELGNLASQ